MVRVLDKDQTEVLAKLVDNAELEGVSIRENYSGRAMYGNKCFGFDLDRYTSELKLFGALFQAVEWVHHLDLTANDIRDMLVELMSDARSDSMGLGRIIYFPHFQLSEEVCLEEDEDPEEFSR